MTIQEIDFSNNSLTSQSADFIAENVLHYKTKRLRAMEKELELKDLKSCYVASGSSVFEELNWDKNHLSSTEAIITLQSSKKMQFHENIRDQ